MSELSTYDSYELAAGPSAEYPSLEKYPLVLFCVPQSVKTKETNPTRPGSPTPCKQALKLEHDSKALGSKLQIFTHSIVSQFPEEI